MATISITVSAVKQWTITPTYDSTKISFDTIDPVDDSGSTVLYGNTLSGYGVTENMVTNISGASVDDVTVTDNNDGTYHFAITLINVNADCTFTASAVVNYSITTSLTNVTVNTSFPSWLLSGDNITRTFTANSGYRLPDSVTVTNATSIVWTKSTGVLSFTAN